MKKCLAIVFLLSIIVFISNAQEVTEKSVSLKPSSQSKTTGITRALVVGISQYQQIHGLQYADKDAEEFSNFLLINPNWKLTPENLILLTNEKAKSGNIITWLNWLLEKSKEGDNIVFYFSGHGDVETTADVSKGFLLTNDCPKNNYITGALAVDVLQNIFSEMLNKGIKVYIIADACRSGHLAGGAAGTKQTAQAFSKQWKNETKILSSQPDEVSYEGPQWGDGRGVFSFFLLKGLNGFADLNKDSLITLSELGQYTGLQVAEATKYKQQPIFEGASPFSNKLSKTDTVGMNRYMQWKGGVDISVYVLKEKGKETEKIFKSLMHFPFLKKILNDSLTSSLEINKAIEEFYLLNKTHLNEQLKETVRYMITGSLMNYLQQLLNQSLIGKSLVSKETQEYALTVVDAIALINQKHRLFNQPHLDNIRRYFFINSKTLWEDIETFNQNRDKIVSMLDSAFIAEPNAAYLLNTKGTVFMSDGLYDSAIVYFKKAMEFSPTWLMPKYYLGQAMELKGKTKEALSYYEDIIRMDNTYQNFECAKCFYIQMGQLYVHVKNYKEAEQVYLKAYTIDSTSFDILLGLYDVSVASKQKSKTNFWFSKIKNNCTTVIDKLNLLNLEMVQKYVTIKESAKRLDELEDSVNTKDEQFVLCYTKGLRKEIFKLSGSINDFKEAHDIDPFDFDCISKMLEYYLNYELFNDADKLIEECKGKFKGWRLQVIQYSKAFVCAYSHKEAEAIKIFADLVKEGLVDCSTLKKIKPLQKFENFHLLMECK